MTTDIVLGTSSALVADYPPSILFAGRRWDIPALINQSGDPAAYFFVEYFTSCIDNDNTRRAYYRALTQFFRWCEARGVLELHQIHPVLIAEYKEQFEASNPTIKQHMAALRRCFDWLVMRGVLRMNPASSVKNPKHIVRQGKTPVLSAEETRHLLDSIPLNAIVGLRDRALIGVMVYSFGRVGAALAMRVEDYHQSGKRWMFRLHEKGGKEHTVPAHHKAEEYVDAYLEAAGIWEDKKGPLFRSIHRRRELSRQPMDRRYVLGMIKRRAKQAGLPDTTCCHTFRATGITAYLSNGGSLENARVIAAHESSQTTRLYDRTGDQITLDEVERIVI